MQAGKSHNIIPEVFHCIQSYTHSLKGQCDNPYKYTISQDVKSQHP